MRAEIPDKLYFKIGEVSKLACVEPHVLRYWETEFSQIQPKRANSNQRLYRRVDVETILQIKSLLHEQEFTISGARKFIKDGSKVTKITESIPANTNQLDKIKKELLAVQDILKK
jgi:DNA-binding transcriptional MerR regulator